METYNTNQNVYIKTDDNTVINEKYIRWIKKYDECLSICTKIDGCRNTDTHHICKIYNFDSYTKLNKHFK